MYRQNIYQCIFSNTGRVHFFFRYKGKQLFEGGEIYIINQSSWIGIHLKLLSLKGRGWSIKFIIIPILCLSLSFPKQVKTMQEKIKKTQIVKPAEIRTVEFSLKQPIISQKITTWFQLTNEQLLVLLVLIGYFED